MKYLVRFLLFAVCVGTGGGVLANVATTAGNNLTAYNGGASTNNNNWNTMSNSRTSAPGSAAPAAANFGNCEAVILRCATPKCSSGGCADMSVARPIVSGCVASSESCKKHGDPLIDSIAARLVAQSTATANAQAAAAAQAQSNAQVEQMQAQMAQMQQAMQDSMSSMQAQMEQQNAAAAQQLESALAEQRQVMEAAQAAAAESATKAVETAGMEGMTVAEQVAAKNNMDVDVLVRSQSLGQIETAVEDATKQLADLKKIMLRLFDYGGCDSSANHCEGPKRVKKFKDIANEFFEPYEGVADGMYDAMVTAMALGVDISQVVMMLSNSCNMWGKYMCDTCTSKAAASGECVCIGTGSNERCYYRVATGADGKVSKNQQHCRLVGILSDGDEVQREWIDANSGATGNIQIACATDTLGDVALFRRQSKMNSLIDIETLRNMINQDAYGICKSSGSKEVCLAYCSTPKGTQGYTNLKNAVKNKKFKSDCKEIGSGDNLKNDSSSAWPDCSIFPAEYALCSSHPYNIGKTVVDSSDTSDMQEVISLKSTLIAQQIKQQYDALSTMVKQLKTHLEKAVLTTKMEIATGNKVDKSGGSSSGKNGAVLAGAQDCLSTTTTAAAAQCLQSNLSLIMNASSKSDARKQLQKDIDAAATWDFCKKDDCCDDVNDISACSQKLRVKISQKLESDQKEANRGYYR